MKKIWIGFLTAFIVVCVSCATMKDKNQLEGNVESVEFAKDGYTAKVKTAKNEIYLATISRVNLGAEKYKVVKAGDKVVLKGEIWKSATEKYIKVTQILSTK
jgi:hypothetical protein